MSGFEDKVVLITGATAGIGAATAQAFAAAGAQLILTGRTTAAGEDLAVRLRASGARAKFVSGDVSNEDNVRAWVAAAIKEFGCLNIAINNAGVEGALGPVTAQTIENFEHVFAINVRGVMLSLKHEIPAIAKQGGAIVNVSSMVGDIGMAGASVYVASKHAVNGLTRSAALETARMGVRVNAIAPGGVITPMYERFTGGNKEMQAGLANAHPVGHLASADDIARTILFMASDDASFMTGSVIAVDGGYTAQ
jgi:NAD(P)-dependent dehydrogenase (short-subunit alcohol dehydrogenase family)